LATTSSAFAASTQFDQFTPLASNVAAGSLPEATPFQLANPNWTQVSIADRATQNQRQGRRQQPERLGDVRDIIHFGGYYGAEKPVSV